MTTARPWGVRCLAASLCCAALIARASSAQPIRDDFYVTDGPVYAAVLSGNTLYIGGHFSQVGPATGGGVPIDAAGNPVANFPRVTGNVYAVAPDGQGGRYIGGDFIAVGQIPRKNLAHILADQTVSPWDPGANGPVRVLTVGATAVYVGGVFTSVGGQNRNHVAALDPTTGLATMWDANVNDLVIGITVSGPTVYLGGAFTAVGGQPRNYIAAVDDSSGALRAWNPNANNPVYAIVTRGATIYVGGTFWNMGGLARVGVAAIDSTTGQLKGWNPGATGGSGVYAMALSGTTIYIGGSFTTVGGLPRANAAAISTNGTVSSWDPGVGGDVLALAVGGPTVYVGGAFTLMPSPPCPGCPPPVGVGRGNVAAVGADGSLMAWNPDLNGPVFGLDLGADGSVFAGGQFTSMGGVRRLNLATFDATTGALGPEWPSPNGTVHAMALHGGTLYLGGNFSAVGGQPRQDLAALDATTREVKSWNAGNIYAFYGFRDPRIYALAASDSALYVGGYFDQIGDQYRNAAVAALDPVTGGVLPWNPSGYDDYKVYALAVSGNTVYVGGTFVEMGGQPRGYIAALDAVTGLVTAWNPNANSGVSALALSGNTVYAGGGFTTIGEETRNYVAALDAVTGLATPWNPNANSGVFALALSGNMVYAGGGFSRIGGQPRNCLAALDQAYGFATAWDPDANGVVAALAVGGGNLFAGGSFTSVQGLPRSYLAAASFAVTGVPEPGKNAGVQLACGPNPLRDSARISYRLPAPAVVSLNLFDLSGCLVTTLIRARTEPAGSHEVSLDGRRLASGIYFLTLKAGADSRTVKVLRVE